MHSNYNCIGDPWESSRYFITLPVKVRAGLTEIVGVLIRACLRKIYYRYAASRQYGFVMYDVRCRMDDVII